MMSDWQGCFLIFLISFQQADGELLFVCSHATWNNKNWWTFKYRTFIAVLYYLYISFHNLWAKFRLRTSLRSHYDWSLCLTDAKKRSWRNGKTIFCILGYKIVCIVISICIVKLSVYAGTVKHTAPDVNICHHLPELIEEPHCCHKMIRHHGL